MATIFSDIVLPAPITQSAILAPAPSEVLTVIAGPISVTNVASTLSSTSSTSLPSSTTSAVTQHTTDTATTPAPTSSEAPTGPSSGNGQLPTTTLIAILVPICVLLAAAPIFAFFWWQRRKRRAGRGERSGRTRKLGTQELEAVERGSEIKDTGRQGLGGKEKFTDTGKQELEAKSTVQELAADTYQRKELETIEKAQELDARRKSQKSHRSSKSTLGELIRRVTTKSTSRVQQPTAKQFESNTPREFGQIEAGILSGMGTQNEVDDELRELRVQQGEALAEREAAEKREAELRRLIEEREHKSKS